MKVLATVAVFAMVALASVTASPHLLTFKGTVLAVETETIQINAVDPETKKAAPKKFFVDKDTKVLRDNKTVKYAEAKIRKGENITITVDHDLDEELAQIIRLGVTK